MKNWMRNTLVGVVIGLPSPTSLPAVTQSLPAQDSPALWQPLDQRLDAGLERKLRKRLQQQAEWRQLLDDQRLAVGLVDLSDPDRPEDRSDPLGRSRLWDPLDPDLPSDPDRLSDPSDRLGPLGRSHLSHPWLRFHPLDPSHR